jgi:hypothetical protein
LKNNKKLIPFKWFEYLELKDGKDKIYWTAILSEMSGPIEVLFQIFISWDILYLVFE